MAAIEIEHLHKSYGDAVAVDDVSPSSPARSSGIIGVNGAGKTTTVELIEQLGLTHRRDARYGKLSGGEKQKVSVGLALVGRPRVAILDELTTGLDPHARRDTWALIEGLKDEGVTMLLVTHFIDEVERLCDRVALIHRGRMKALRDRLRGRVRGADGMIFKTELKLTLREPIGALFSLGLPLVFGLPDAAREPDPNLNGKVPIDTVMPSLVLALAVGMQAIFLPPGFMADYRAKGILRRRSTTAAHPRKLLGVQAAVAVVALPLTLALGPKRSSASRPAGPSATACPPRSRRPARRGPCIPRSR